MKPILESLIVAIVGDFGDKRSAGDLKRWIEANGGAYSTTVSAKITHLICSQRAWSYESSSGESAALDFSLEQITILAS